MSARPYSWFPLATADPVPGDPDAIAQDAARYAEIAGSIQIAADSLGDIADSPDMVAKAVDAIRSKAEELSGEVGKAHDRYETIANALSTYALALQTAQAEADALLTRARTAQHAIDSATTERTLASSAWTHLDEDATDDERRRAWNRLTAARTEVNDTEIALQHLRDELDLVIHDRDAAAQRAMDSIGAVMGGDELNDGWWLDWGADALSSIASVAGNVAAVAGLLSLVLGWVPILGQALALVAAIAGAVALASDFVLALTKEQGWGNFWIDAFGAVTFGAGRGLTAGVRVFARSARSAARSAVTVTARSGSPAIAASATSITPALFRGATAPSVTWRSLVAAGRDAPQVYIAALRAARTELASAHGLQRFMVLSGNGGLSADLVALDAMREALRRPQAAAALDVPMAMGVALEHGVLLVAEIDTVLNASAVRRWVDPVAPEPNAAERLGL